MNLSKPLWIVAGVLFAAASVAIHDQVKVRLHDGDGLGAISAMGKLKVGQAAPDFSLADLANQPVTPACVDNLVRSRTSLTFCQIDILMPNQYALMHANHGPA